MLNGHADPDTAALSRSHAMSGTALARQGRFDEAASYYEQALALNPSDAETHNNLGNIRKEQGRPNEAIACYKRSIAIQPDFSMAHNNLGIILREQGRPDDAATHHRQALILNPGYAEAYYNLGNVLQDQKKYKDAGDCYQRAIALKPNYAEAYMNLGNNFRHQDSLENAGACYQRAAIISPNYAEAHYNLGNVLFEQGRFNEAMACHRLALTLRPDYVDAYMNLGNTLQCLERFDEAIACYQRVIALKPDHAEAHVNEAFVRLLAGDFIDGWRQYEWRWRTKTMQQPNLDAPMWKGEDLQGKTILLHCEQGLGDSIQFIRYASMVKKRGGQVLLSCPEALSRLFESVDGIDQIISSGMKLPHYDYHAPLLSLPMLFETRLDTVPCAVPYLFVSQDQIEKWAQRLEPYQGMRVGLVWAGNPRIDQLNAHVVDRRRSMHLHQFAPLATLPDVQFLSLQKGLPTMQLENPPQGLTLTNFMNEVEDFADTAALIANLDLVIGVDTSVIHLAGAMGKPVWVLSRFDGCWRWFSQREDSPWYPTLRLFRQPKMGDWQSVVESVRLALISTFKT